MLKAFTATILILASILVFVYFRTGLHKEVEISSGFQGPFVLVYKTHTGPYHKIVPVIEEVEAHFDQQDQPCPMAFGRYLYNPSRVDQDRLKSHGGCAFVSPKPELRKLIEDSGFEYEDLPAKEYVVASFEGSPSMGPIRVYPRVEQWLQKYGYSRKEPVIELYQTTGEDAVRTRYLFEYEEPQD